MRDHGGNIDSAKAQFGGSDWIDLSTGINRVPYPVPAIPIGAWQALPTRAALQSLTDAALSRYRADCAILPTAGAQAAIQMIPRLRAPGEARVLAPTYNEHAASLRAAGWQVKEVCDAAALHGADLAVIVNPNNPDGQTHRSDELLDLTRQVGTLVVDESFGDMRPELSVAPKAGQKGLFVLRSFGKFYGLAGVRLGFVLGHPDDIATLSEMSGPWPVSGAAIEIGRTALRDDGWAADAIKRLRDDANRMDAAAGRAGWGLKGGTDLFRLYETANAKAAQTHLAHHQIWSRIFPWSDSLIRLGLPAPNEWARVETALTCAG